MSRSTKRLEVVCPHCGVRFRVDPSSIAKFFDRMRRRNRTDSIRRMKRLLR